MVDFGYDNNAIRNQNLSNTADSVMIVLTEEPLPCRKAKKEWKFKCKSWIKKLLNCCLSQNITKKVNSLLNVSMLFLFIFISTLTNIRQINWIFLYQHEQNGPLL